MSEEGEYLSFVHGQINAIDRILLSELLFQASHFQACVILHLSLQLVRNRLKVASILVIRHIILVQILYLVLNNLILALLAQEVPWFGDSKVHRHDLVKVEPECSVDD